MRPCVWVVEMHVGRRHGRWGFAPCADARLTRAEAISVKRAWQAVNPNRFRVVRYWRKGG